MFLIAKLMIIKHMSNITLLISKMYIFEMENVIFGDQKHSFV